MVGPPLILCSRLYAHPDWTDNPTDSLDMYTFHALGIIVADLDPRLIESAPPVDGFTIDGCRSASAILQIC